MDYRARIERARRAIAQAEFLVIGGGAGLSAAAGIEYAGEAFERRFAPFIARYGFTDLYTSSFYPFETEREKWAYWALHISMCRFEPPATALYRALETLARGREHAVITTNVDGQFGKAGFPEERLFAVQGDYARLQCASACHDALYDDEAQVEKWLRETRDCRIPEALVPRCPVCGGPMAMHLRVDDHFVEDDAWRAAHARYEAFLGRAQGARTVYLELGVGWNTPGIVRLPFEQMTNNNPRATLIRLNRDQAEGFPETAAKSVVFREDMARVVGELV